MSEEQTAPPLRPSAEHLSSRAARLFPDHLPHNGYNRRAWMRAVAVVRSTKRGWVMDDAIRQERVQ